MMAQMAELRPADTEAQARMRLEFVKSSFAHTQDLIRFMDQKASFILTAVGILTTSLGIFTSIMLSLMDRSVWHSPMGAAGGLLAITYLALAFAVVYTASGVLMARSSRAAGAAARPNLFFLPAWIDREENDRATYLERLRGLEQQAIIEDYAGSTADVAAIYRMKEGRVNSAIARFRLLSILWISMILFLLIAFAIA